MASADQKTSWYVWFRNFIFASAVMWAVAAVLLLCDLGFHDRVPDSVVNAAVALAAMLGGCALTCRVLAAVAEVKELLDAGAPRLPRPSRARLEELAAARANGANGTMSQSDYFRVYSDVLSDLAGLGGDDEGGSAAGDKISDSDR